MKTFGAILSVAVMVLGSTGLAGPLKMQQVPADANRVVHVDVAALVRSDLGKGLLAWAQEDPNAASRVLGDGRDDIGDLRELADWLGGATWYTRKGAGRKDVVILALTGSADKRAGKLGWLLPTGKDGAIRYGRHKLEKMKVLAWATWLVDGSAARHAELYATAYDANTAVFAPGLDELKRAIDVLDGKARSLAETKGLGQLPEPAAGQIVVGAMGWDGRSAAGDANAPARTPAAMSFEITIKGGQVRGEFLVAGGEKFWAEFVQGDHTVQLVDDDQQDLATITGKVVGDPRTGGVRSTATVPTESLLKLIRYACGKGQIHFKNTEFHGKLRLRGAPARDGQ